MGWLFIGSIHVIRVIRHNRSRRSESYENRTRFGKLEGSSFSKIAVTQIKPTRKEKREGPEKVLPSLILVENFV
jgi:hypothetical protein